MSLQTTTRSPTRNETCDNKAHIFPSHPCTNKTQRPTTNFVNSNNKGAGHFCNSFKQVVLPGLPLQQGPNTAATRIASSTFFSAAPLRLVVAATKLAAATLVGHSCHFFFTVLRGLLLQHDCNITATRTATQPRNAVFYHAICVFDLAKARSLSKRFKTFKHGAGQVYPVNYSVAWLCCSSCCSYVAVVLQFKSTQHSKTPFTGTKAFGSCAPLRLPH